MHSFLDYLLWMLFSRQRSPQYCASRQNQFLDEFCNGQIKSSFTSLQTTITLGGLINHWLVERVFSCFTNVVRKAYSGQKTWNELMIDILHLSLDQHAGFTWEFFFWCFADILIYNCATRTSQHGYLRSKKKKINLSGLLCTTSKIKWDKKGLLGLITRYTRFDQALTITITQNNL